MTTATASTPKLVHAARPGPRPIQAEDLWDMPRVGVPAPFADGSQAIVPVTTWNIEKNESKTRLWLVDVAAKAAPRPLTSAETVSTSPAVSPDGTQLAFLRKDAAGRNQVHVLPLGGGEARVVTDMPLGTFDPKWLPDGSGLVFGGYLLLGHLTPEATKVEAKRRDEDPVKAHVTEERLYRYWDTWLTTGEVPHLFHWDAASGAIRDLTPASTDWFDWMDPSGHFDISPDGRRIVWASIVFDHARSLIVSRVHVAPMSGGPAVCLTPAPPAEHLRPRWSPDGTFVLYGRTEDPEFYADRVRLMRWFPDGDRHEPWLADWKLSPVHWEFMRDGRVVFEAEDAGRVRAFVWHGSGEPRAITSAGAVTGVTPCGPNQVTCTWYTLSLPNEAHAIALDGGAPRALTSFTSEVQARYGTGEVREVTFAGTDGVPVQMFVVLPVGHVEGRPVPLVHMVHGGPHGIFGDQFHPRWNAHLFASPGYIAALVNFQGSTSWGQEFAKSIRGEWARRPFGDVMQATDLLVASGLADERRLAMAGGSYGGYMAAWFAGHTDRFRCIVNHAGVADLTAQYASDVTQGRGEAAGGEIWDGLDKQDRWSPIRFASDMKTPMLVLHGEKDYRVPVGQGLLMYGVLKAKGVPARLVYFPDENHWVLKARNSLLWCREVLGWLERWLKA